MMHLWLFICSRAREREREKSKMNSSFVLLLSHLCARAVCSVCVCSLHKVMCLFIYTWELVSRTAADLAAFTRWHFPSSGCSPDIFLVSDQSWFSQMSHSLRYTSLNEGSASVFAKTQPSMKKNLSSWQSKVITRGHGDFNVSLHCADSCAKCSFHDDTGGNYVSCQHSI